MTGRSTRSRATSDAWWADVWPASRTRGVKHSLQLVVNPRCRPIACSVEGNGRRKPADNQFVEAHKSRGRGQIDPRRNGARSPRSARRVAKHVPRRLLWQVEGIGLAEPADGEFVISSRRIQARPIAKRPMAKTLNANAPNAIAPTAKAPTDWAPIASRRTRFSSTAEGNCRHARRPNLLFLNRVALKADPEK